MASTPGASYTSAKTGAFGAMPDSVTTALTCWCCRAISPFARNDLGDGDVRIEAGLDRRIAVHRADEVEAVKGDVRPLQVRARRVRQHDHEWHARAREGLQILGALLQLPPDRLELVVGSDPEASLAPVPDFVALVRRREALDLASNTRAVDLHEVVGARVDRPPDDLAPVGLEYVVVPLLVEERLEHQVGGSGPVSCHQDSVALGAAPR